MKFNKVKTLSALFTMAVMSQPSMLLAKAFSEAISDGDTTVVFRLRYESVNQRNSLKNASALTLRSVFQYDTSSVNGFSGTVQFEDSRVVGGIGDYSVPLTGYQSGVYSVIADPQSTEVNQAFVKYVSSSLTVKAGRQVINYDNQRFVGAVGWRQDWQVYDGVSVSFNVSDILSLNYNFIDQRNRIFADEADVDSNDHLFNASYQTPIGKLVGYAYLLENDNTDRNSHDTVGMRLTGSAKIIGTEFSYTAEFASQKSKSDVVSFDADYYLLEGGLALEGLKVKLGYEVLGSDGGVYGFSTPLATAHAFNGWADVFLGTPPQGLQDLFLNVSGNIFGGTMTAIIHDFQANDESPTIDDLGSEINLQYIKNLGKNYTVGVKYSKFSDGDIVENVDTNKLWFWLQASF